VRTHAIGQLWGGGYNCEFSVHELDVRRRHGTEARLVREIHMLPLDRTHHSDRKKICGLRCNACDGVRRCEMCETRDDGMMIRTTTILFAKGSALS
jgi:hypothetical protein